MDGALECYQKAIRCLTSKAPISDLLIKHTMLAAQVKIAQDLEIDVETVIEKLDVILKEIEEAQ